MDSELCRTLSRQGTDPKDEALYLMEIYGGTRRVFFWERCLSHSTKYQSAEYTAYTACASQALITIYPFTLVL